MKIASDIIKLVGKTPMVKLNRVTEGCFASVIAKLEFFNPCSSIKDRVAVAMLEDAEKKGLIKKGCKIVEPSSGNTGIGLAFVCAVKGYNLTITMPDTMSSERQMLLKALGANLVLTSGSDGMTGAVRKAEEIAEKDKAFMPQQFDNPSNADIHKKTTAVEIWDDTEGKVDIFVAGVGTGGTVTGVGEFLKAKNSNVKIVAVEPSSSPVISGGKSGVHKIQGIGAGFIPKILNRNIIDEIIPVCNEDAFRMTRLLIRQEGVLAGVSSGAAVFAAVKVAERKENSGKTIVVILPDTAERYMSTGLFREEI
ncbi:MAG: O-acetylserine sulfhydrylase [Elusimicrobia bacterium ADurb.Bin231]|nr:MAG: O-acetylserine sulfhydrylase [Elusimicrobia bacterium ADurb.Bin231]